MREFVNMWVLGFQHAMDATNKKTKTQKAKIENQINKQESSKKKNQKTKIESITERKARTLLEPTKPIT